MDFPWHPKPQNLNLERGEIHLWYADLYGGEQNTYEFYKEILSTDELERAQRFKFSRHQRRFIYARGILRVLLGKVLKSPPNLIEIQYAPHGKPYVTNGELFFNLAHCQDKALYGFCLNAELGVDIECLRELPDAEKIAKRFFSALEYKALINAPEDERTQHFFSIWTLKEAFIKAVGQGLSYPLDAFDIQLDAQDSPTLKVYQNEEKNSWSLFSFYPETDCIAGVAVNKRNWILKKYRYQLQD